MSSTSSSTLSAIDEQKKRAAEYAVGKVETGMKVGLGTGSTARFAVAALGERVRKEGLKLKCIPTSEATRKQAEEEGITVVTFDQIDRLDICFDGADEADPKLNLTKGGGGALLREKVVAFTSAKFYCIVDEAKLVDKLYAFPLPLEVIPFAVKVVEREVAALGGQSTLRQKDGKTYVTDNGLWILDCRFSPIEDPPLLAKAFSSIPGIAEHGLFCGMVHELVVGTNDGIKILKP
ncbi:MAG: ribose-5-phosphate isomerase RpiA [Deltaproteobacteria bacterium]|nr:ribose-5-phosphate isomerase RpiA [Deltaproteobacteria bacterium]